MTKEDDDDDDDEKTSLALRRFLLIVAERLTMGEVRSRRNARPKGPRSTEVPVKIRNGSLKKTLLKDLPVSRSERKSADEIIPPPPSALARLASVFILLAILAVWGKLTFVDENNFPGGSKELHSWKIPFGLNVLYLVSLPLLRVFSSHFLSKKVDVKLLLREPMIIYNASQVLLNGWMVYRIVDALLFRGHPVIGGGREIINTGASFAVWVHYCDKYLEYLDTYFMVLRGRMDQVRAFELCRRHLRL